MHGSHGYQSATATVDRSFSGTYLSQEEPTQRDPKLNQDEVAFGNHGLWLNTSKLLENAEALGVAPMIHGWTMGKPCRGHAQGDKRILSCGIDGEVKLT